MEKTFKFDLKDGSTKTMDIDEFTRWACLIEAMTTIFDRCDNLNINVEKDSSWLKPLAVQKYIHERFPAMRHDIEQEIKLGNI